MYLGQQMTENETLQNEYKEFCIKTNVFSYYTQDELDQIIQTGKVTNNFNNLILDNLKLYCDIYIPKYASAFANSKILNGNLQIGVNDNGEITGVPFCGELSEYQIIKLVEKTKNKFLFDNVGIKVKVVKLKYHDKLICDQSEDIISKIEGHNTIYYAKIDKYYKERTKWASEVLKYSVKLSDIVKNEYTRNKFHIWLNDKQCPIYNIIINTKPEDIENIKNKRNCIGNINSIIHWIAMYKDETMGNLQKLKPENPNITKFYNSSYCLMTQLTDLRVKLFVSNKKLNYFKINIHFDINKYDNVCYKKINRKQIYKSYRMERKDFGPYSVTNIVD